MIDIHTHILCNIDDGASSMHESMRMLTLLQENGVDECILTPHFRRYSKRDEFVETRDERIHRLEEFLKDTDISVKLHAGCEFATGSDFLKFTDFEGLTLAGSRYLLLEFPFENTHRNILCDIVQHTIDNGLIPIIAHPERFIYIQRNPGIIDAIAAKDVLFQINLTSLSGEFGPFARQIAVELVNSGFAGFISTDIHTAVDERGEIIRHLGECGNKIRRSYLSDLLYNNPSCVVRDEEIARF